ncbi:MAG TPA: S8 family serine peptidase [Pyrinomonadaceae bacterium]
MLKKIANTFIAALIICSALATARAATLSPTLQARLGGLTDAASAGTLIVSFNTTNGLNASHLNILRGLGIKGGYTLPQLGMVVVAPTAGQVRALAANSAVRSIWTNDPLYYYMNQARVLAGVDRLRSDSALTTLNGGLPVSGKGDFSVVINDSGIDATHDDLKFGTHVVQNVQVLTDSDTENSVILLPELDGFFILLTVENVPNTDTHVGHGTHCAGIVGGSGQRSGGRYAGVAPGAKLIGTGSGAGLFILNALGGYEWSLANQFLYNIRVISNSWGSSGAFNPDNPINIATKDAYDRNIITVIAAGNDGPAPDTHNPYAKAPWVISVGAGTKEGGLAGFSSRGTSRAQRLANSDPNDDYDAPTVVAPGTGREFDSNSAKFSAAVVSTRSSSNVVANGLTDDTELDAAYLPFYTQISGTSMATPFVSGTVALMLDADPTLNPDEVKQILQQTASQMPGYDEYQVGAGYINSHAAVDKVFNRSKGYGSFTGATDTRSYNATYTTTNDPLKTFTVNYTPQTPGPQATNTNAYRFNVSDDLGVLDVRINFGTNAATRETGNSLGLALYPPGCVPLASDPQGVPPCAYNSGLALPALDAPSRRIVVQNPAPGQWVAEVRGVRGLASAPQASSPVGIAVPERVDGTIRRSVFTLQSVPDIGGLSAEQQKQIRQAVVYRLMDLYSDGTFRPDQAVTRGDFARLLMWNTPLRQSLGATPKFADVSGDLAAIAEAATAKGSTLRDWNFVPAGLMSYSGNSFNPGGLITRVDLAVAFIRALGLDSEARALAGTTVKAKDSDGQTKPVLDNAEIPSELRGYVQIAIDKGFLEFSVTSVQQTPTGFMAIPGPKVNPNGTVTRAQMAAKLNAFAKSFSTGN